jgi:hypothetical protein
VGSRLEPASVAALSGLTSLNVIETVLDDNAVSTLSQLTDFAPSNEMTGRVLAHMPRLSLLRLDLVPPTAFSPSDLVRYAPQLTQLELYIVDYNLFRSPMSILQTDAWLGDADTRFDSLRDMPDDFDAVDFRFEYLAEPTILASAPERFSITRDTVNERLDRVETMCFLMLRAMSPVRELRIGTWPRRDAYRGMGPLIAQVKTLQILILHNVELSEWEFLKIGENNPELHVLELDGKTPPIRHAIWRAFSQLERLVFGKTVDMKLRAMTDARLFHLMPALTTITRKYLM